MLLALSAALEASVSTLLGETVVETKEDDLKAIAEKLKVINLQLAQRKAAQRKAFHWLFVASCAGIVLAGAALIVWGSPYLGWDYHDPETAVMGTAFHAFEWLFFRAAPIVLTGTVIGAFLTREKE